MLGDDPTGRRTGSPASASTAGVKPETSPQTPAPAPGGREAVVARALEAAETLFAARGPQQVSVRDIAAATGVSHALLHRYLGGKDDIVAAVFARHASLIQEAGAGSSDLRGLTGRLVRDGLTNRRQYLRLIVRAVMDGVPYEISRDQFPGMRELARLATLQAAQGSGGAWYPGIDPRFLIATLGALYLGWAALDEVLLEAAGLAEMSAGDALGELIQAMDALLLAALPWDEGPCRPSAQVHLGESASLAPARAGSTAQDPVFGVVDQGRGPRGGGEVVKARVLEAAGELFTTRGPHRVSVRDIAARAGVSHALVHRYLGSKDDILARVILSNEQRFVAAASGAASVQEAALLMLRDDQRVGRAYMGLVVRVVLDRLPVEAVRGSFPATRRLVGLAQAQAARVTSPAPFPGVAPAFAVTAVVALALGWVTAGDWLVRMVGLDDWDRAAGEEQLHRVIDCLLTALVPE